MWYVTMSFSDRTHLLFQQAILDLPGFHRFYVKKSDFILSILQVYESSLFCIIQYLECL